MDRDYRFGNAELLTRQRMLLVDGKQSRIGARAFDLLLELVEHRHRIVTKDELLDSVWPGVVVEENNLQVHISSLRKLLGPQAIMTVPGRGYRFTAAITEAGAHPSAVPAAPSPPQPRATPPTNLPQELPQLYGRTQDIPALRALLDSQRLVTVVGPSGIGKTAVAQALAHQVLGSYADGAWLVDLSSVASASLVAGTVAGVLHIALAGESQVETLAGALKTCHMLIVIDNCEHVSHAVAELAATLYRTAPQLRLIATSQEPLKVAGEHVYRLGPLGVPGEGEDALEAGAVALFEARARAADSGFALGPGNLPVVVEICRRLDGIPLAIELAAARVPVLGVAALRARLDERFRLLSGGDRLALPRHQTLLAALDWSHALLTPDEQTVFRRLGVFAGSFGLDSAQRVASGEGMDAWDVLNHLGALVDKSLVVAETGDTTRYRMLETSRVFAMVKLSQASEVGTALRSHAQAVLAVFEASRDTEHLLPRQALLERHLPDLDNARAALDWSALPGGDDQLHVALAGAMAWMWSFAGLRAEGMRRTRAAMALIKPATPPHAQARLLGAWSRIAWPELGRRDLEIHLRAIELYRSVGDRQGLFCALCELGLTLSSPHDPEFERAIQEAEQMMDPAWPIALRAPLLAARGCALHRRGDFEKALAAYDELQRLAIALGDSGLALNALVNQEQAVAALGRWEESVARGKRMLELLKKNRALRNESEKFVVCNLCIACMELGKIDEAVTLAHRAYVLHQQAGHMLSILDPLARLAFERGRTHDAARVAGRADMRYATSDFTRQPVEAKLRDGLIAALRSALPAHEMADLMRQGESLSDDEAARLALHEAG